MEVIKQFLRDVGAIVMSVFGINPETLTFSPAYFGLGALLLLVLIVVLVIVIIKKATSKKKKAKAISDKQVATTKIQPEQKPQPVEQEKVQVVEEEKVEPIKQEKVEVVEEQKVEPVEQKAKAQPKQEKPASTVKEEQPKKEIKKLLGKWIVEMRSEGEFDASLLASNGEVMLTSEIYTTEEGARKGIGSIIRGVENGKFVVYETKNGNYYYKLKSTTNRILCVGEIYKNKDQCLKAVESVKRIASSATVTNGVIEGKKYIEYVPQAIEEGKALKGKWRIEKSESGNYSAKLYANNGQLMLSTEEVSQEKSAKNAIESVKKNAESANFVIDTDKFGRYYYKLRNVQKTVICIGESYESLDSCISAIESVRRFARNSVLVEE